MITFWWWEYTLHSHLTQYCLPRLVCYKAVHYSLLNASCWIRSHTKQRLRMTTGGWGCLARCAHTVHPPLHPSQQLCALRMITHFTAEETEAQPKVIKLASAEQQIFPFKNFFFLAVLHLHCCVGFSLVAASRGYSSLQCTGFSSWQLLLLQTTGSRACRLQELWHVGSMVAAPRARSN